MRRMKLRVDGWDSTPKLGASGPRERRAGREAGSRPRACLANRGRRAWNRVVPRLLRKLWCACWFLLLAGPGLQAADSPLPRKPSPIHTPFVATAAPEDPPGYRAEIEAIAQRYVRLYYSADLKAAWQEAQAGLAAARRAGSRRDEIQFLKAVSYVAWLLGDAAACGEHAQRLVNLVAGDGGDDPLRSIAHRLFANSLTLSGDRATARIYDEAALRFAESAGDAALRAGALNNLANHALAARDYATARRLHREVLAYREQFGERWDVAGTLTNLGDVAMGEREFAPALDYYRRALAIRDELGDQRGQVRSRFQVAAALRQLGRTDEAIPLLEDALGRAEKITGRQLLGDVWHELALTREARGELALALAAERRAAAEREAFAGERARTRLAELQARLDLAQKQTQIEHLESERRLREADLRAQEAELTRSRLQQIGLIGLIALAVVGFVTVVGLQRARLRAEHRVQEEIQAARVTAEAADRMKTRFLGIASHDVRTPLNNIISLVGELRRRAPTAAEDLQLLDLIGVEAQRVSSLVRDLLDVAALEAGKLELRRRVVDFSAIVREALDEQRPSAKAKRVTLQFDERASAGLLVEADGARMHQVVANLVGNAIKYSPSAAVVEVALDRRDDQIVLSVRDHGAGLAPTDLERLFQPFTRLSSHPTAKETSHGLGLSIVQEIVRVHGGEVRAESAPGQGMVVFVALAAHPGGAASANAAPA